MDTSLLNIQGLTKSFGSKRVLDQLDLELPKGSIMGLLGKNGAGKTTLLKCSLGLCRIDGGRIRTLGEDSSKLSAKAKARIGYAPQVPSLQEWMKVQQLLNYTAAFYSSWNAELVTMLVKDWKIDPSARVSTLSHGDLQKLSILLALGHEPELLILDEPAASLDPAARRNFLRALLKIVQDGERTILFSTHYTPDLERVADQVAILKDGKIWFSDSLDALKDSVKRLHIRASAPLPEQPSISGMISYEGMGDEAEACVRDIRPEQIQALEKRLSATIEVRELNLEEIFMEVHHGS